MAGRVASFKRFARTSAGFVLFACVCLLAAAPADARQADAREDVGLSGPAKSLEVYAVYYPMKDGRPERGPRRLLYAYAFNREGRATEFTSYDQRGNRQQRFVNIFDAEGRVAGREDYGPDAAAAPQRHVFVTDAAGRRVEQQIHDSDGKPSARFTKQFDAEGRLVEEAYYTRAGALGSRSVYAHDGEGRPLSRTVYNEEGRVASKIVWSYDKGGRQSERLDYDGERLRFRIVTRLDERGRPLRIEVVAVNLEDNELISSHGPQPGRVVYAYDDPRRTRDETTYGPDNSFRRRVRITLDERGTEASRTEYNEDGTLVPTVLQFYDDISKHDSPHRGTLKGRALSQFEYDAHGNWTKKTYLILPSGGGPPQPYSEEERVIVYY